MTKRRRNTRSTAQASSVGIVVLILIVYAIYSLATGSNPLGNVLSNAPPALTPLPGLPPPSARTTPLVGAFHGCPPEGDGGDPDMNRLKNRIDPAPLTPVKFETVFALTWPPDIERRDRVNWQPQDAAQVAQAEGLPVSVEGYLWGGRESGPESPNCHALEFNDWHVWVVGQSGQDRTHAIVVEPTPRILALHGGWTLAKVNALADAQTQVRITGWLFLDPEHPDQIGKTRGTIWEIHPVTEMEVLSGGTWEKLDDYQP